MSLHIRAESCSCPVSCCADMCTDCLDWVPLGDVIDLRGLPFCDRCAWKRTGEDGDPDRRDR